MKYTINNSSVVINKNDRWTNFSKKFFNQEILKHTILNDLSMQELKTIWKELYGIPSNIKDILLKKVELYKSSPNVHSFIFNEKEYWISKEDRTSLWNLSNSSLGDIEFVVGDDIVTMSSIKLKAFLLKLEVYAYKCFVNKSKHISAINKLENVEDIINYDYTTGYPEKIILE